MDHSSAPETRSTRSLTSMVVLIVVGALLAAGTAFGAITASSATIVGTPTKALCPPGGKVFTVGYDTFSDSQEFAAARWKGLQYWQKTLGCIKFIKLTDNADGTTALSNVKIFVGRKVNGVLLLQVVASAQAGIVNLLKANHIPVMATDIAAPNTPYLSASDHLAGVQAGQALAAGYKKLHTSTAPWVVLGTIPPAGPAVQRRMDGAKATLQKLLHIPSNHFISLPINQQTAADAFNAMRSSDALIPSNAPVLVTADNDELTLGIYNELKQSGKGRKFVIVGIGGLSAGLQSVCKYSDWAGTVDFAPYKQTGYIVSEMLALMKGQKVPATYYTPTQVVTKALDKKLYPADCK